MKNLNSEQKNYLQNVQKLLKQTVGFCEGASIDTVSEDQFPDKKTAVEYFNNHNRALIERLTDLLGQAEDILDTFTEDV